MIMSNTRTGSMVLYDISNDQITSAYVIGTVGLDWQFAGLAPVRAAGTSDFVLRNVNTGAFQVYWLICRKAKTSKTGARQYIRLRTTTVARELGSDI
jgi:hypothetical protein